MTLFPLGSHAPQTTPITFLINQSNCALLHLYQFSMSVTARAPCRPQTTPVMSTYTLAFAAGDLKSSTTVAVDAVAGWVRGRSLPYTYRARRTCSVALVIVPQTTSCALGNLSPQATSLPSSIGA